MLSLDVSDQKEEEVQCATSSFWILTVKQIHGFSLRANLDICVSVDLVQRRSSPIAVDNVQLVHVAYGE